MEEKTTLKGVIREEIDTVTGMIVNIENDMMLHVLKLWLQSLQTIDNVCKNRNRY